MKNTSYDHPPITEAIIGINFAAPLELAEVEKLNGKFLKLYPQHQSVQNVNVKLELNEDGHANADRTEVDRGHRRTNADINELVVLWRAAFTVSQLAPYPGWEVFFARFVRDWKIWKRTAGFRSVSRIGVRFINRIDIPIKDDMVKHEAYLNVYPKLPDVFEQIGPYAVQAQIPLEDIHCVLTLNSASVPAPILGHGSYLIDLDIAKNTDPPQNDKDIFALLNQIRTKKNEIFEACISNDARALFRS